MHICAAITETYILSYSFVNITDNSLILLISDTAKVNFGHYKIDDSH